MDESPNGVVYFTFGSMVLIETLSTNLLNDIYASFKKISPIRILMKVVNSSKLPVGLPGNVKILPWIPQQPILGRFEFHSISLAIYERKLLKQNYNICFSAHRNTKVFITHVGLGGVQEAVYFGVPMIGIPLFADQFRNAEALASKKILVPIAFDQLSEISLDEALVTLLYNHSYRYPI